MARTRIILWDGTTRDTLDRFLGSGFSYMAPNVDESQIVEAKGELLGPLALNARPVAIRDEGQDTRAILNFVGPNEDKYTSLDARAANPQVPKGHLDLTEGPLLVVYNAGGTSKDVELDLNVSDSPILGRVPGPSLNVERRDLILFGAYEGIHGKAHIEVPCWDEFDLMRALANRNIPGGIRSGEGYNAPPDRHAIISIACDLMRRYSAYPLLKPVHDAVPKNGHSYLGQDLVAGQGAIARGDRM